MSTRSRIGIRNEDGTITSIYCHSDGYVDGPCGVGYMLHEYWSESVLKLIEQGDMSSLGKRLGKDEGTGAFDRRHLAYRESWDENTPAERKAELEQWLERCFFYRRDRGDTDVDAATHPANRWPDSGQCYEYLWVVDHWVVRDIFLARKGTWRKLSNALAKIEAKKKAEAVVV